MNDKLFLNAAVFGLPTVEDSSTDFGTRLEQMLQCRCIDWSDLPREQDLGYVEYKWKLGQHVDGKRIDGLATQMRFRLQEGGGKAYYVLGVRDSGVAEGLSPKDHILTVQVLMEVAQVSKSVFLLESFNKEQQNRWCSLWRVIRTDSKEVRSRLDAFHVFTPERPRKSSVELEMKPDCEWCPASAESSAVTHTTRSKTNSDISSASLSTEASTPRLLSRMEPELEPAMIVTVPTPTHASAKLSKRRKKSPPKRVTAPAVLVQDKKERRRRRRRSGTEETMLAETAMSTPEQDQKLSCDSNMRSDNPLVDRPANMRSDNPLVDEPLSHWRPVAIALVCAAVAAVVKKFGVAILQQERLSRIYRITFDAMLKKWLGAQCSRGYS